MKDVNMVFLNGCIKGKPIFGKSTNGKNYASINVMMVNTFDSWAGSDENERQWTTQYARVMSFDKKIIEYLTAVGIKDADRVEVKGWLSSRIDNIRGRTVINTCIVARDIMVIKTVGMAARDLPESGADGIESVDVDEIVGNDNK